MVDENDSYQSSVLSLATWGVWLCGLLSLLSSLLVGLSCLLLRLMAKRRKEKEERSPGELTVGFFHPYCNAGGGGERVLWRAVRCAQTRYPAANILVYTGDTEAAPDQILTKARDRFDMTISEKRLSFVYLHQRRYVEARRYPYFTILGQSLGSLILGLEALFSRVPDIYIDTMGYAFTLPLFKYIGGCKVGCYVHYPTISTDMLSAVQSRRSAYNNNKRISRNPLATFVKLKYYRLFAKLYGMCGRSGDTVMVNSSWTEDHVTRLWETAVPVHKVFPPCDVTHLTQIVPTRKSASVRKVLSLGQFRPEKDHPLQIKAMYELRQIIPEEEWDKVKLIIIGGCRGAEDEKLVQDLRDLCKYLSVENNVEFRVNLGYPELLQELADSLIGIHTMWNEHFGIGIVEMMAAGLLTVAHRSGGPLMDIVIEEAGSRNGFLAATAQEYAAHIAYIISMTEEGREGVRERARASVNMFSSQQFDSGWIRATDTLFQQQ